jgi:hypothetical protein
MTNQSILSTKKVHTFFGVKLMLTLGALLLFSCNSETSEHAEPHNKSDHHGAHTMQAAPNNNAGQAVKHSDALSPIINNYLQIKDALVESNSQNAAKYSASLLEFLDLDKQRQIATAVQTIQSNANDLAAQRQAFKELSLWLKRQITEQGTHIVLYEQFCPMYKGNEGGMWLSAQANIQNPYFGDAMMQCGSVQGEYKPSPASS